MNEAEPGAWRQLQRGRVSGIRAGTHRQRRGVFVVLECRDWRRVTVLQVVPRPALPEAAVLECRTVPDDLPVDARDPGGPQARRPLVEQQLGTPVASIDRGITGASHDQIALQHALIDRTGGFERGLEAV